VVTRSALCSSAGVTYRYSVTLWHDVPLPAYTIRSQHVTTSTHVGLRAQCTLQSLSGLLPLLVGGPVGKGGVGGGGFMVGGVLFAGGVWGFLGDSAGFGLVTHWYAPMW
jgi:hypothetical protein